MRIPFTRVQMLLLLALLGLIAVQSSAQTYTVLHGIGLGSCGRLELSGETLYGTIQGSGLDYGSVFKLNLDGTGYSAVKTFAWGQGEAGRPAAGVLVSGDGLYGSTQTGMTNNGYLFWVRTNGSDFTVLKWFNGLNGAGPLGLIKHGSLLYGTTQWGGRAGTPGTIFQINTDGSDHVILHDFNNSGEYFPTADLVLSDGVLYGTTTGSGTVIKGSVFKMNTNGSDYRVLKEFTNETATDGLNPEAGLALSGTTLFGATSSGGLFNHGTIFKVETDGAGFTVLKHCTGQDGESPRGPLLLAGGTLFGTTEGGGSFNRGTIFKLDTGGSNFAVLKHFTGADGAYPRAALLLSDTNLYGTTYYRLGLPNPVDAVVFRLSLTPPVITTSPQSQTAEVGSSATLSFAFSGFPAPECQWYFDGHKVGSASTQGYLRLANIQFFQAGGYVAVLTNAVGGVTSAPASLNVIPPVERRPVPGISLFGDAGSLLRVDYADPLGLAPVWTTLDSVSLTSTSQYCFDLTVPLPSQRFYRAWPTGSPSAAPMLDIHMISALTLAGRPGDKIRVEGINQFGPTDAWFTLDTVTLTNASQLYFDVTAPDQPARLYRLVPSP